VAGRRPPPTLSLRQGDGCGCRPTWASRAAWSGSSLTQAAATSCACICSMWDIPLSAMRRTLTIRLATGLSCTHRGCEYLHGRARIKRPSRLSHLCRPRAGETHSGRRKLCGALPRGLTPRAKYASPCLVKALCRMTGALCSELRQVSHAPSFTSFRAAAGAALAVTRRITFGLCGATEQSER